MIVTPELGVPYSSDLPYIDLRKRVDAACNTIRKLEREGLQVDELTREDEQAVSSMAVRYAGDPEKASNEVKNKQLAKTTPAALLATQNVLDQFGHAVVQSAVQIRHTVTNKLLQETENPDPKIRIRALELLGKISDVGLFSEKSEVTVTHKTTDELRESLRSKLSKLVKDDIEDAVVIEETLDLTKELRLDE